VLEECQIQGCANGIFQPLFKHNMATIIAVMKSIKDVCGIVSDAVIVTLHIADPVTWWRRWQGLRWMFWVT
jgi:hypothetical protein